MIAVHQHAEGDDHGAAHGVPDPLAILESDVLLTRLLARGPVVVSEPTLGWDDLIEGYFLRDFELRLTVPAA
jgi:hypothetical protein